MPNAQETRSGAAPERGLRERKKIRTRERIVEEAFDLFREHGYDGTTIETIADEAMVSSRTVFRYFERKSDIVFAETGATIERMVDRVRQRYTEEPTVYALVDAFADYVGAIENDGRFALRVRLAREHPELFERALAWRQEACDQLARALAEQDGEAVPTLEHRALVQAVFAAWTSAIAHRARGGEGSLSSLTRSAARTMHDRWTTTG